MHLVWKKKNRFSLSAQCTMELFSVKFHKNEKQIIFEMFSIYIAKRKKIPKSLKGFSEEWEQLNFSKKCRKPRKF